MKTTGSGVAAMAISEAQEKADAAYAPKRPAVRKVEIRGLDPAETHLCSRCKKETTGCARVFLKKHNRRRTICSSCCAEMGVKLTEVPHKDAEGQPTGIVCLMGIA